MVYALPGSRKSGLRLVSHPPRAPRRGKGSAWQGRSNSCAPHASRTWTIAGVQCGCSIRKNMDENEGSIIWALSIISLGTAVYFCEATRREQVPREGLA